jgi:hypothetical protein
MDLRRTIGRTAAGPVKLRREGIGIIGPTAAE